jgi:aminoglycoside 3-N-acetyltransferase
MPTENRPSPYRRLRSRLKAVYFAGRGALIRRFRSYGPPELDAALRALGVAPGDTVLLHAGFTPWSGFTGSPQSLVECLLRLVGPQGHLLMVSMAYTGSALEYLKAGEPFDVGRTMSRMGLVSEIFRRRRDVHRSRNPVHPILAHGPRAEWLIADHDATPFSCGEGTPFEKLAQLGGKILLFDVSYLTATFLHHLEHRFRTRLGVRVYHDERIEAAVVTPEGTPRRVAVCVFEPTTARARDQVWLDLEPEFRRAGALRAGRVGNTPLVLMDARRLIECADRLLPGKTG